MSTATDLAMQTKRAKAYAMECDTDELLDAIGDTRVDLILAQCYDYNARLVPQITNILGVLRAERDHRAQLTMSAPVRPENSPIEPSTDARESMSS